ncbi:MAG: GTPase HflX [Lachnospiraceae bacterium]|nr:GTPase HflX [Lachnospiraceae bacterium]MCI7594828.1 GTPase HflX [Lachnospiraceae bacterium]MDD7051002.1 GTPase HflX [Lachnospiraceae bacterium]MDY3224217.1 GTPase HflX [Lachnospiraceae bacterium]MDY4097426.1 GTPase HflX [Lachnospiraceae bacterium]
MIENEYRQERGILVGINLNNDPTFDLSMKELKELARACHIEVVCIHSQKLSSPNSALCIGSGKLQEIKEDIVLFEATTVIFDNTLSPVQVRNLSRELNAVILDRTSLILRIFEERAKTGEAKMQVELAKYQYMLPRLVGLRDNLSRQGGASGALSNKGAGEKKLELDRRRIEKHINELKQQLAQLELNKATMRKKRSLSSLSQVALVGYTNAGKSTILNALVSRFSQDESKLVLEKDMLFATLETKVRQIAPPGRKPFLLSDTVGFIDKLPHQLIKAFRSTLQEVREADLLLHVVDYSDPDMTEHLRVTQETLQELSAAHIPMLYIYNKIDKAEAPAVSRQTGNRLYISAKSEEGVVALLNAIEEALSASDKEVTLLLPFSQGHILSLLAREAQILSTEYTPEGTLLTVRGSAAVIDRHLCYQIES